MLISNLYIYCKCNVISVNKTYRLFLISRECTRREFCNFIHLKPISRELHKYLYSHRSRRHSLHSHSRYHDGTRRTRSSSTRHDHHRNNHRGNESSGGFGGGRGERRNHRY